MAVHGVARRVPSNRHRSSLAKGAAPLVVTWHVLDASLAIPVHSARRGHRHMIMRWRPDEASRQASQRHNDAPRARRGRRQPRGPSRPSSVPPKLRPDRKPSASTRPPQGLDQAAAPRPTSQACAANPTAAACVTTLEPIKTDDIAGPEDAAVLSEPRCCCVADGAGFKQAGGTSGVRAVRHSRRTAQQWSANRPGARARRAASPSGEHLRQQSPGRQSKGEVALLPPDP
jgi:hypothetical protein